MASITAEIKTEGKKSTLVISIPISEQMSKSGKNLLIATTAGNKVLDAKYKGKAISLGLNAWVAPE